MAIGVSKAGAVTGSSVLNRVTVVIPTHNRPQFLNRLLAYFESFDTPVSTLVLDSSAPASSAPELSARLSRPNVRYLRYPSERLPINKIAQGLQEVNTPYAVLCADDDFTCLTGVAAAVQFLDAHPDYALAQGYFFTHHRRSGFIQFSPMYLRQHSVEMDSAVQRVTTNLKDYPCPTFYAVHRSEVLAKAWEQTAGVVSDWGLSELLPASLSLAAGKFAVLPVFYASRTTSGESAGGPVGSQEADWYESGKCERAIQCLAQRFSEAEGISIDEALTLSRNAFEGYLSGLEVRTRQIVQLGRPTLRQMAGKILTQLGLRDMARLVLDSVRRTLPWRTMHDDILINSRIERTRIERTLIANN